MKYEIGDKVKVKSQKEREKYIEVEYDFQYDGEVRREISKERYINIFSQDRIFSIIEMHSGGYILENFPRCFKWTDDMIEYSLAELEEMKSWIPIIDRFEILDL